MAWTPGNSLGSNSSALVSSLVITTGAAHNAGERIEVAIGYVANTVSSVADSAANVYTLLHTKIVAGQNVSIYVSNGNNALASGQTITVTMSALTAGVMACAKAFAGGSVFQDGNTDATGASATNAAITWNPGQATELATAAIVSLGTAPGDYATPAGWTNAYDFKCTGVNICLRFDYAVGLAKGSRTDTWTGTLKNAWSLSLASLYLVVPGTGGLSTIPMTMAG